MLRGGVVQPSRKTKSYRIRISATAIRVILGSVAECTGLGFGRAQGVQGKGRAMRGKVAALVAVTTMFLSMPAIAASVPFYGPPVGAAKKACFENGGVWTPYLQTCTV